MEESLTEDQRVLANSKLVTDLSGLPPQKIEEFAAEGRRLKAQGERTFSGPILDTGLTVDVRLPIDDIHTAAFTALTSRLRSGFQSLGMLSNPGTDSKD